MKLPLGDIDSSEQLSGGSVTEKFNLQIHRVIPLHADKQHELKQVHCVLLQFITQLKVIYHLYRYNCVPYCSWEIVWHCYPMRARMREAGVE